MKGKNQQNGRSFWHRRDLFILILLILATFSYAALLSVDNFVGEADPFNITFTGNENQTFQLDFPSLTYVANLTLNLEGFLSNTTETFTFDANDSIAFNSSLFDGTNTGNKGADFDFDTYAEGLDDVESIIWENFTLQANFDEILLHTKNLIDTGDLLNNSCFNYSSNEFVIINQILVGDGQFNDTNITIPTDCLTTIFQLKTTMLEDTGFNIPRYYESELIYINKSFFPTNSTLEIGIPNNFPEWNHTGEFNLSINQSLNISKVNEILNNSCDEGEVIGGNCRINFTFHSDQIGKLGVGLTNSTVYINITFNIFDRETGALITDNVGLTVLGITNYSTTTGIINDPFFPPDLGPHTAITSSNDYVTDQLEFTIASRNPSFDIFLTNSTSSDTGNLIVEVSDEAFNLILGANVKLLEYNAQQDAFIQVAQCFSNSNGECIFDVELNTKFYIAEATITRDGNIFTARSTETGELIKLDNTIIELHLRTSEDFQLDEDFDLVIVVTNTTLVGNTSFLTATFNDPANNNHTVCISYSTLNGLNEVEQAKSCVNASAGIVNFATPFVLDRDFNWIAKVTATDNEGLEKVYDSFNYKALEGSFKSEWNVFVIPIIFAIVLGLLGISIYLKNMKFFGMTMIGFSPLALVLEPTLMGGLTMTFIIVLCLCLIYCAGKKQTLG